MTYQDNQATGHTYYAFLAIGLATIAYVHLMWYVPLLWILMRTQLQSMSWRTWLSSLLGLVTPYWFLVLWLMLPFTPSAIVDGVDASRPDGWIPDLTPIGEHFVMLADLRLAVPSFSLGQILVFLFTLIMTSTGIVHFWQYSFEDKIRIRLLYGFFTTMTLFTMALILLQPQHYDVLMPVCFVCACPIIAHVLTFTKSRLSNILFLISTIGALAITVYNIITL